MLVGQNAFDLMNCFDKKTCVKVAQTDISDESLMKFPGFVFAIKVARRLAEKQSTS